jgi:DNA-binding CsgD family transcriptional regulator
MATANALQDAHAAYADREWSAAFAGLSAADAQTPLDPEDLDRLAVSAFMTGRQEASDDAWERAQREWLRRGDPERAARCAFWLAFALVNRGEMAHAGGWIGRARRVLDDNAVHECGAHGLLQGFEALGHLIAGDCAAAIPMFEHAARIGLRCHDLDVITLSRLGHGQGLALSGRTAEGLAVLDEVMVTVTTDEVSPQIVGLAYCAVISVCQEIFDLRRAQEWTRALGRWCASQPDLVPYRGQCLVHRAEIALLRLAQGQTAAATGAIRRALDESTDPVRRPRLLSAYVEIALAGGDVGDARRAADELTEVADRRQAPLLCAIASHADGAVLLAEDEPHSALSVLRRAWDQWHDVSAPYDAARARVLIARACRALGDDDTAEMEFDAARWVFDELGAAPDLVRVSALSARRRASTPGGLTLREVQVLRLVATGKTNRAIAADLFLSEKTVARHVANIFTKLDLASRAAATAYAYEHQLVWPHAGGHEVPRIT